jgi:hypothetical protein
MTPASAQALWLKVRTGTATQAEMRAWEQYKTQAWKASRS